MKMEPNNMENQFKDKLNKREIKPSENSWDRLDAMLAVAEKPKRNYQWMYFAASFLGFILIATVFFNQTEELIDVKHQEVVVEPNPIQEPENSLENVLENPIKNDVQVANSAEKAIVKEEIKNNNLPKSNPRVAQNTVDKIALSSNGKPISAPIINQKTEINVDANALLASVETEKPTPSLGSKTIPVKINSNELLSQVDDELELSFRQKVLKSVNKRYQEVKVAVAKRNLE